MSFASLRRHRPSRASSLNLPPNFFARAIETMRRPDVLFRVSAFILAVLVLWLVTGAGDWTTIIGFGYNSALIPDNAVPKTQADLLNPALSGKLTLAGTTTGYNDGLHNPYGRYYNVSASYRF